MLINKVINDFKELLISLLWKKPEAMKEQIELMTSYGLWADEQLCERIDRLPNEQLDFELKSSFPSIRTTMGHIYDAYLIWTDRLSGGQLNHRPSKELDLFTTDHFKEGSKQLKDYTSSLNEQDLNMICTYSNL